MRSETWWRRELWEIYGVETSYSPGSRLYEFYQPTTGKRLRYDVDVLETGEEWKRVAGYFAVALKGMTKPAHVPSVYTQAHELFGEYRTLTPEDKRTFEKLLLEDLDG